MSDVTNEVTNEGPTDLKAQGFKDLVQEVENASMSIRDVMSALVTAEDPDGDVVVSFRGSEAFEVVDVDFDENGRAVLNVR